MTARTRAHAYTTGALASAAAGGIAALWQSALAVPGLAGAVCLLLVAASYRADHRRNVEAFQAVRAAVVIPDPAPMPDWDRLAEQARYDETFGDMISHYDEEAA